LEKTHKAAVLEVGTNHPGELPPLLQMIRPRYSVITSIGREHLEFFGDISGVIKEEGALADFLPANGKLFINGENEWIKPVLKRTRAAVVKVGQAAGLSKVWGQGWAKDNCFCARNVRMDETGISFAAIAPNEKFSGDYRVNLLGRHQVVNALLAIAVGAEFGLSREEIQTGLAAAQPAKMRMQIWSVNGVKILDDSYNANADSMLAALETLHDFPSGGRRVAVLGDMAELGNQTEICHREIGRRAAELGVRQLFAVGKMAAATANGARGAGLQNVTEIGEVEAAAESVKAFLKPGDVVLLKASRSTRLERIGELLKTTKS
jgi:UDP-N-acetylmuramyl pentapeptide synthase